MEIELKLKSFYRILFWGIFGASVIPIFDLCSIAVNGQGNQYRMCLFFNFFFGEIRGSGMFMTDELNNGWHSKLKDDTFDKVNEI